MSRRALQRRVRTLLLAVALATGCATLPEVPQMGAVGVQPVKLAGAGGPLSREQSAAVLQKLKQRSGSIDILERHIAIEEAVVGSPLVTANRVTLLEDGPATYKAMFEAIRGARDHINLETYIFEDDDVGHRFAELLLKKQAQGVQVNVIYDNLWEYWM